MEVQRCKHCWEEPKEMRVGNDWVIFCNCLLYSCYSPDNTCHATYEQAVTHWNAAFGRDTANGGNSLASQTEVTCTCDSQSLLWLGCTCEYARRKRKV